MGVAESCFTTGLLPQHHCWGLQCAAVCVCSGRCSVCCSVLQCVAVCYSELQCVVLCCSVLQCVSQRVLQCVAECAAVCCSVLQCVLQCLAFPEHRFLGVFFTSEKSIYYTMFLKCAKVAGTFMNH